jgi:transcriptional regulator with PAS, ATPase and Fis domain
VRGAFTGASVSRDGVFRAARGGTVFLDEIGELPLAVQAKLLRVIENRDVLPLGADRAVPTDFRLVAATHQPLEKRVEEGTFRQDLLFRLDVVRIDVPPLRERLADLPELAERLLERHARSLGRPTPRLSTAALAALRAYRWPGNVRELSNLLERSALFATGPWIDEAELPAGLAASGGDGLRLREAVQRFEQQHVRHVLALHGGDKRAAAETLGVHLATLYRHLERVGDDEKDP